MKTAILVFLCLIALAFAGLYIWRLLDHRADRAQAARLLALQPVDPPRFTSDMVADLPAPARRYFNYSIREGTALFTVAQITMTGKFGMGDQNAPNYMDMRANQVLAAPHGFLWKMSANRGGLRISGSDSTHWTRFWLAGLAPVARFGGTPDHSLSGFGRYASEAIFWTPAAVLPQPGVIWQPVDDDTARVTLTHNGHSQAIDLTVDAKGRPTQIMFQRWSNANPEGEYRFQPFGGTFSEFREFQGFRLPTRIEAGNFFGTQAYFPFFIAEVSDIRFVPPAPSAPEPSAPEPTAPAQ